MNHMKEALLLVLACRWSVAWSGEEGGAKSFAVLLLCAGSATPLPACKMSKSPDLLLDSLKTIAIPRESGSDGNLSILG